MNDALAETAGRILAIDDDRALPDGVVRCLERAGFRVATAPTLHDGLRLAAAQAFDACLLDRDAVHRLSTQLGQLQRDGGEPAAPAVGAPVTLDELERHHIAAVLAGSTTLDAAARTLGIDTSTLYRKRKAYGL